MVHRLFFILSLVPGFIDANLIAFSPPPHLGSNGSIDGLTVEKGRLVYAVCAGDERVWMSFDPSTETYGPAVAPVKKGAAPPVTEVSNDGTNLIFYRTGTAPRRLARPVGMDVEGSLAHALHGDGQTLAILEGPMPTASVRVFDLKRGGILYAADVGRRSRGLAPIGLKWLDRTLLVTFAAAGPYAVSVFFDGNDGHFLGTVGGGKKPLNTCTLQVLALDHGIWAFFSSIEGRVTFQEPARGSLLAEASLGNGREDSLDGQALRLGKDRAVWVCPGPGAGQVVLVDLDKWKTRVVPAP